MIKKLLLVCLVMTSLIGLASYSSYNMAPTNAIFEAIILLVLMISSKKMKPDLLIISFVSISYVAYSYILARYYLNTGLVDFALAYKTFVYLPILCLFANKSFINKSYLNLIFKILLISFILKYFLWHLLAGTNRPGLFFENNFELIFLLLTALSYHHNVKPLSNLEKFLIFSVFLLSGSRSGLVILIFVVMIFTNYKLDFKLLIKAIGGGLILGIVALVFISRQKGAVDVENIDRFIFLQSFFYSLKDWSFINYLFGNFPLTPLDNYVCTQLQYYQSLFSTSKQGVCYSLVLHSYWLRMILDHGFIGVFFILSALWILLGYSNVKGRYRLAVIGIVSLNGLSVSALNSVYVLLGLVFVLSTYQRPRQADFSSKVLAG